MLTFAGLLLLSNLLGVVGLILGSRLARVLKARYPALHAKARAGNMTWFILGLGSWAQLAPEDLASVRRIQGVWFLCQLVFLVAIASVIVGEAHR